MIEPLNAKVVVGATGLLRMVVLRLMAGRRSRTRSGGGFALALSHLLPESLAGLPRSALGPGAPRPPPGTS